MRKSFLLFNAALSLLAVVLMLPIYAVIYLGQQMAYLVEKL